MASTQNKRQPGQAGVESTKSEEAFTFNEDLSIKPDSRDKFGWQGFGIDILPDGSHDLSAIGPIYHLRFGHECLVDAHWMGQVLGFAGVTARVVEVPR